MRSAVYFPCFLCSFIHTAAQEPRRSTMGIGLHYGEPLGAFAEAGENGFLGVGATAAFTFPGAPIDLGFGLNWDWLDKESFDVPVSLDTMPNTMGELIVKGQSYGILPLVRLRPFQGAVMPYLEAFGGARLFMTNSKVEVDYLDKPIHRDYHQADVGLAWGWAAGLMVKLGDDLFLELRYAASWGSPVTYVDFNSVEVDDQGEVTFETLTSNTQARRFHIGIAGCF